MKFYPKVKRVFDVLLSGILIVFFLPVIIIVAVAVAIFLGQPILFKQYRPGLYGKPIKILKFRTMLDAFDSAGHSLSDEQRLTFFGRFLRASSLDELPQLVNVLKGDMSLIGPRPLLLEYLPLYTPFQNRRHEVRPGITGWAQVNGRNAISWEDKFKFDVWYVDNLSFWLDLRIIFLTVKKVLLRDGISAEGEATMSRFSGSGQGKNH